MLSVFIYFPTYCSLLSYMLQLGLPTFNTLLLDYKIWLHRLLDLEESGIVS